MGLNLLMVIPLMGIGGILEDGSEVVQCPCKGGEGNWNPTVVLEENTI